VYKRSQSFRQGRSLEPPQAVFVLLLEQSALRASVGAACIETSEQNRRRQRNLLVPFFDRMHFVFYILGGRTILCLHQNGAGMA
jgi:hypothetical protein